MKNPLIRCTNKRRLFVFNKGMFIGRFGVIIHEYSTKDEYAVLVFNENEAVTFTKEEFKELKDTASLIPYRKIKRSAYKVCKAEYEHIRKEMQSDN